MAATLDGNVNVNRRALVETLEADAQESAEANALLEAWYPAMTPWPAVDSALVWAHAAGVAFGLLGNVVARLALAGERRTRLRATGALMSGVCEANLLVLATSVLTGLAPLALSHKWLEEQSEELVGIALLAGSLHSAANTYLLYCALLLAFDRATAAIDPLSASLLARLTSNKPRGIRQRHALLLLLCVLLTAPSLFELKHVQSVYALADAHVAANVSFNAHNQSLNLKDAFPGYVAYKLFDLLLEFLVPVALITALNVALVFSVRKALAEPLRRHSPTLASERGLFLMVMLSTLFLHLCELPTFCFSLVELPNVVWDGCRLPATYWQFAAYCIDAFASFNVLVCVLSGRRFRQQLMRLCGVRRHATFAPEPPKRSPSACGAHRAATSVLDERTLRSMYNIRMHNGRLVLASAHVQRSGPKHSH